MHRHEAFVADREPAILRDPRERPFHDSAVWAQVRLRLVALPSDSMLAAWNDALVASSTRVASFVGVHHRRTTTRLRTALSDRYRVGRELNAGVMATMYLAHDLEHDVEHDRDVATEVLRGDVADSLGLGPPAHSADLRAVAERSRWTGDVRRASLGSQVVRRRSRCRVVVSAGLSSRPSGRARLAPPRPCAPSFRGP